MNDETEDVGRLRIDKFLFFTRFFKTRSLAGKSVTDKGARLTRNGQTRRIDKASANVEVGDVIAFSCPQGIVALTILSLPTRRGPAVEARACYQLADELSD